MRRLLRLPTFPLFIRLTVLLIFISFLGQAQDGDDYTYDGETLDPVITESEAKRLFRELLDVDRLVHSVAIGKISKDVKLVEYSEGFMERNNIEVLTIGYIESDAVWPKLFKNNRLKKIEKTDNDDLIVGKIIFVPVEDGEDITGYTVELQLTGKTASVYELLDITKEELDIIGEETTKEELGTNTYAKPKLAQDAVVDAMIKALQRVEEGSEDGEMGVVDSDGNVSQGGSGAGNTGGTDTDESLNEIIIVYNGADYKDSDEILIEEGSEEITLEAKSNQELTEVAWEGAVGDGAQATLNILEQSENEFIEVKVTSGELTTTVQLAKKKPIKITSIDKFFAPTVESVDITYQLASDKYKYAKLQIFKNGDTQNPIYEDTSIPVAGDLKVTWDGKMNKGSDQGKYISVFNSPYTATITVSKTEDFADSFSATDDTKVEIESLTLTPNGKEILYKPSRTAVEIDKDIEAQVLIKNKQKNGVPTVLPFTIHWSFEDPDDPSSDPSRTVDINGNLGNDNTPLNQGGKTGTSSIMWKSSTGYTSRISFNQAESDVSTSGQSLGKSAIQFSSSVIAGDNYILVAQIKDANGTVIKEEKTQEWLVRKQHSFNRIYEMAGSHNMTQMMSTNNIDPAYSQDGCTDYTLQAGSVINLTGANAPEFIVPLSPPNQAETPTAQELQDYASNNPAVSGPAQVAITAKAQAWFNRVNGSLSAGKNAYLQQAGIRTPAIIGARYYHPKLDGRPGQTNYYPAGIIINAANGNNSPIYKDPDDDWRPVQGFRDSQDNAWIFLNISSTQRQQIVARHEIGHTTDHECFDGPPCGPNSTDHASRGLMHYTGDMQRVPPYGDKDFSKRSINKLRGRR